MKTLTNYFATIVAILLLASCSEAKKTQKAVNRVLADRSAINKVGEKWRDLNPCANVYTPGKWMELPDSLPLNRGNWGITSPSILNPFGDAQIPHLIPPATTEPNGPEPIPFIEEREWPLRKIVSAIDTGNGLMYIAVLPEILISADEKSIQYNGRTYWYPQKRWLRVDTVRDKSFEDSLLAKIQQKDLQLSGVSGQLLEKQKDWKAEKDRADKWFWLFIGSVIAGIVLLIATHLIRSQIKLPL